MRICHLTSSFYKHCTILKSQLCAELAKLMLNLGPKSFQVLQFENIIIHLRELLQASLNLG